MTVEEWYKEHEKPLPQELVAFTTRVWHDAKVDVFQDFIGKAAHISVDHNEVNYFLDMIGNNDHI